MDNSQLFNYVARNVVAYGVSFTLGLSFGFFDDVIKKPLFTDIKMRVAGTLFAVGVSDVTQKDNIANYLGDDVACFTGLLTGYSTAKKINNKINERYQKLEDQIILDSLLEDMKDGKDRRRYIDPLIKSIERQNPELGRVYKTRAQKLSKN